MMLTLDTNLKISNATTQYTNFDFNSMVNFNGVALAANDQGLFELSGDTDNLVPITAYFEPVTSDIGVIGPKRMRYLYVEAKLNGKLNINISVDGETAKTYSITNTTYMPLRRRIPITRDLQGTYWLYQFQNVDGADFSIDSASGVFTFRNQGVLQG